MQHWLADPQFLYRVEAEHPELADGAIYRVLQP